MDAKMVFEEFQDYLVDISKRCAARSWSRRYEARGYGLEGFPFQSWSGGTRPGVKCRIFPHRHSW